MILRQQNLEDGELRSVWHGASLARNTDVYRRFLLKYVSRDEVVLLGRGNGGIVEIRNAIAQFEEPAAPLFGFLRYRRRNVVIKYVPEECSRLVQGESCRTVRSNFRRELTFVSTSDSSLQCRHRTIFPTRYRLPYRLLERASRYDSFRRLFSAYCVRFYFLLHKLVTETASNGDR